LPNASASQSAALPEAVEEAAPGASGALPQEARHRIMSELVEMIGRPDSGFTRDDWMKVKDRYWLPEFDATIRDSTDATTVRELLATPDGQTPLIVQLLSGSFESQDPDEQEALLALHNMALVAAATGGSSLYSALADRQNDPNITRGDLVIFEVFNDAFQDVPRSENLSRTTLQEWEQLAGSPNDLVRLLALRTFSKMAPQPEQWLDFYRLYVNDPSDEILAEAAEKLFQTALPEAVEPLIEMRSRSEPPLPEDFAAKLDRSVEFLSNLPSRHQ
jgi:hypothetical protein